MTPVDCGDGDGRGVTSDRVFTDIELLEVCCGASGFGLRPEDSEAPNVLPCRNRSGSVMPKALS
eukprot:11684914-Prorocentrum_lima.AAC.1